MFYSCNDFDRTLPYSQGRSRYVWILSVQRTGREKVNKEFVSLANSNIIIRFEKRNVPVGGCQVYKQTLLELFEIVKEESELYENCMADEENQV